MKQVGTICLPSKIPEHSTKLKKNLLSLPGVYFTIDQPDRDSPVFVAGHVATAAAGASSGTGAASSDGTAAPEVAYGTVLSPTCNHGLPSSSWGKIPAWQVEDSGSPYSGDQDHG